MIFKLSEKKLAAAIVLCTLGIYLTINNTVDFSEQLISEKALLLEVSGLLLTMLGAVMFYKSVKKVR